MGQATQSRGRLLDAFAALGSSLSDRRLQRAADRLDRAQRVGARNPVRLTIEGEAADDVEQATLLSQAADECRNRAQRLQGPQQ